MILTRSIPPENRTSPPHNLTPPPVTTTPMTTAPASIAAQAPAVPATDPAAAAAAAAVQYLTTLPTPSVPGLDPKTIAAATAAAMANAGPLTASGVGGSLPVSHDHVTAIAVAAATAAAAALVGRVLPQVVTPLKPLSPALAPAQTDVARRGSDAQALAPTSAPVSTTASIAPKIAPAPTPGTNLVPIAPAGAVVNALKLSQADREAKRARNLETGVRKKTSVSTAVAASLTPTLEKKKFQCKFCDKRFSRPSSLTTHTYTHTGERPHMCSIQGCGRSFSVLSNLRRHVRVCSRNSRRQAAAALGGGGAQVPVALAPAAPVTASAAGLRPGAAVFAARRLSLSGGVAAAETPEAGYGSEASGSSPSSRSDGAAGGDGSSLRKAVAEVAADHETERMEVDKEEREEEERYGRQEYDDVMRDEDARDEMMMAADEIVAREGSSTPSVDGRGSIGSGGDGVTGASSATGSTDGCGIMRTGSSDDTFCGDDGVEDGKYKFGLVAGGDERLADGVGPV
ncbi:hypothetical protein HK101_001582 [Irineochytrium annulatum]|nr:hypothetical protein HK101_001582 [Irineochytrium annulatum]